MSDIHQHQRGHGSSVVQHEEECAEHLTWGGYAVLILVLKTRLGSMDTWGINQFSGISHIKGFKCSVNHVQLSIVIISQLWSRFRKESHLCLASVHSGPKRSLLQRTARVMGTPEVAHLIHHLGQHQHLFTEDKRAATGTAAATHEPLGAGHPALVWLWIS